MSDLRPLMLQERRQSGHGVRGERSDVFLGFNDEAVLILLGELSSGADDLVDQARQSNQTPP
jgi:hypothetical protein